MIQAPGKIISLDVGTKRVGIAVSDESRMISFPREVIEYKVQNELVTRIGELVTKEKGTLIVIGVPLDEENEDTRWCTNIRKIGEKIHQHTGIEVVYVDEFLSTKQAQAKIPTKKKRKERGQDDMIAAQIILERFINR